MNTLPNAASLKKYHVRVGLAECTVACQTEQEAVQLARVRIAEQLPQVRVLLEGIRDKEFRVDLID